jgi:hypothetical protein
MSKRYVMWLVGLLAVSLALAACGGTAESVTEATMAPTDAVEATTAADAVAETQEAEAAVTEAAPATDEVATDEAEIASDENTSAPASTTPAICQAVEIPDNQLIAPVSAEDWSKGPADAEITLIEYGDFQ